LVEHARRRPQRLSGAEQRSSVSAQVVEAVLRCGSDPDIGAGASMKIEGQRRIELASKQAQCRRALTQLIARRLCRHVVASPF
jgi:hypothetical protein